MTTPPDDPAAADPAAADPTAVDPAADLADLADLDDRADPTRGADPEYLPAEADPADVLDQRREAPLDDNSPDNRNW